VSIFERTRQPSGVKQSNVFVNRERLVRHFINYVNEAEPRSTVLFLHGTGGNGKSALLRHLQREACRYVNEAKWEELIAGGERDLAVALSQQGQPVPVSLLDFGGRPHAENRPQEPLSALFMMKRQLAEHGLCFPRFDFAAITYLHKTGLDFRSRLPELFPHGELTLASEIADALAGLPVLGVGRAAYTVLDRLWGERLTRWRFTKGLAKEDVAEVLSMQADPDLFDALPVYFARDLNAAAGSGKKSPRVVLLFDTHEALWGEELGHRDGPISESWAMRDEWLRVLLGHLELDRGIVAVVAGRSVPPWSEVRPSIPAEFVDAQHIGELANSDADLYLRRVGIDDPKLRAALIDYAHVDEQGVHPYFLGLCADAAIVADCDAELLQKLLNQPSSEFAVREKQLISRVLTWVPTGTENALIGLAACRAFTVETIRFLGDEFDFPAHESDIVRILGFSFIAEVEGDDGKGSTFRMHSLLRRVLARLYEQKVQCAHRALAEHYRERAEGGDFSARVEMIYHTASLKIDTGVRIWMGCMDQSLATGRFDRARELTAVLSELQVPETLQAAVLFRLAMAQVKGGSTTKAEALLPELRDSGAHAGLITAEIAFCRGEFEKAAKAAAAAMPLADAEGVAAIRFRLAEIQLYRGRFEKAESLVAEGLRRVDEASSGPGVPNRSRWLSLEGEIALFGGDVKLAEDCFEEVVRTAERASEEERDLLSWAMALNGIGLVKEVHGDAAGALDSHRLALRLREQIEDPRGIAHSIHGIGKAHCLAGDHASALSSFAASSRRASDLGDTLLHHKICHSESRSRLEAGEPDAAKALVEEALSGFRRHETPFDIAHANATLGRVREALGDPDGALAARGSARRSAARNGFELLFRLFPELRPPAPEMIGAGFLSFAAGDAFGVPWEGAPPKDLVAADLSEIPQREDWPRGSTSDDTAQLILAAEVLCSPGLDLQRGFIERLSAVFNEMRGVGPTTTEAVRRWRSSGEVGAREGGTNGAAMRALPLGWGSPIDDSAARRRSVLSLSRATHGAPAALIAAGTIAAMGTWSLEGVSIRAVCQGAADEAAALRDLLQADVDVGEIALAAGGIWQPPAAGVSLEALETVAAVVHVLRRADSLANGIERAIRLGGDTDTVAAIVAGILGTRGIDPASALPWFGLVQRPDMELVHRLADGLTERRNG
jgi:ADP-ribosylglycohydrolase/predicted negative regulator of RcsB-dependent stress response